MTDPRDPRFDPSRRPGPPRPAAGPPPRPPRPMGPPPGQAGPAAAPGGPPPGRAVVPPVNRDVPLLTHDDAPRAEPMPPRADAHTTVTPRPSARPRSGPGGPGGPGGPRDPGGPGRGGGGGGGDEPPLPPEAAKKRRWRRIRRVIYVAAGVFILGPILAFVIGWLVFQVPTADDAKITQVATFTYADGAPLATVRPDNVNRTNVTLDKVPEPVRQAVLAAEDRTFYSNFGFDVTGIMRAIWNQVTGGVGGGSTITQQYIKVTTGQDEVSLWRKYKEVVLAAKISKELSKDQILENYLNVIYLGRGAYGVQAASQAYFGKDVSDLSVSEGAMLAGMIQSPSRWDPAKTPDKTLERWNFVLDGMVGQGWLSPADRAAQKFPEWRQPAPTGGGIPGDSRGHIYNLVRAELEARGISDTEINTEGLTITTTIDPEKQQAAVAAAQKVMKGQPANLRTALVSVDPKTGAVLAYYGGDNGVGLDYAQVLKQPGSSFKPFVLAAALQLPSPVGLGSTYDGSSPMTIAGAKVSNSEGVSCGNCTVKTAMTQSINTVFYQIAVAMGPAKVADAAHQAGIPADLLPNPTGGISLGDKEVHPMDMAAAFATFAADGVRHDPYLISKVTASDGRVLFDIGAVQGQNAFPQQVARNVTESMTDVASSSGIALSGGRPVASKTGTVQSSVAGQNNDAWTVGYTPSISTAVWVGTDDNSPIKNSAGRPIYGRMLPGSIWQQYMNAALKGTPVEQFSKFVPIGTPPYSEVTTTQPTAGNDDEDYYGDDRGGDNGRRGGGNGGGNGDGGGGGNRGGGNGGDGGGNGGGNDGGGNARDSGDGAGSDE
ncbi:transglycosylase domain-containing protein [Pseudonocardia sulfidoxydans]|uniref:transglycosylase domain-containing protein n=1 Tax=Pseudonocardia sulfidoxydans TaxID=54011 RepID=UPI001FE76D89|nr:transglycosylase domain-containing protein [Pseudonocardia sulfidoxydans]